MEIVPGLHQLKTPFPAPALPYIIPYVFQGADGVSLFDAGFGTTAAIESLTAQLAALGTAPKDIRRVFVSHAHPDHIGMTAWIKEQSPDCELIMLEREWQWIQDRWLDNERWMQLSDRWMVTHGVSAEDIEAARAASAPGPERQPLRFVEPDLKLQDGEVVEFDGWTLRAVWTPGHTPGHMCMYEPNHRLMFTGDHVLPYISPNVSLNADQEGTSPLSDFRDSLRKVADFDTWRALPAHEFTIADLRARCEVLLHHHDDRLEEIFTALGDAPSSGRQVAQRVLWNTGTFDEFNIFMKRGALGETLSHLRYLQDAGRVRRIDEGERTLWEAIR